VFIGAAAPSRRREGVAMPHPGNETPIAPYAFHADLATLVGAIAPDSIVSRLLHHDDRVKVTLFGFAAGQELSEHTASKPAILQVLAGAGTFGLGDELVEVGPGSWVHMAPNLPHTVTARTELVLLLTMLKDPAAA
jgi:quercetin dioxygenase-like cupin family protein